MSRTDRRRNLFILAAIVEGDTQNDVAARYFNPDTSKPLSRERIKQICLQELRKLKQRYSYIPKEIRLAKEMRLEKNSRLIERAITEELKGIK